VADCFRAEIDVDSSRSMTHLVGHKHSGRALGTYQLRPDAVPVSGPQVPAPCRAIRESFDLDAPVDRNSTLLAPLDNGRRRDAEQICNGGRAAELVEDVAHAFTVAPLNEMRKPCLTPILLASLHMTDDWDRFEEGRRLRERFDELKRSAGVKQTQFAKRYSVPGGASYISQHFSGNRPISMAAGVIYAQAFGVPLADISPRLAREAAMSQSALGPSAEISPPPLGRGLAQDMSQYRITVAPQPIAWERLTVDKDQLPNTFTLALPDDALTPRLRRGDQVELNRNLAAEPGDLVLVRDGAGQHYVREYRRHRPDDWTAAALNGAYTSLVASQDQLEIIGVVEWERRGRHRD
jgi:hypothetical protein